LRASQNGVFSSQELIVPCNPDALSLIGFTLLVEKLMLFNQRSATFRETGQGQPPAVCGVVFNSIQPGMDLEVPKMRMQLRMNQFKKQKRTAPGAKIFSAFIRRAAVVQRAVTLGMPVVNVAEQGSSEETDAVVQDYLAVADEIIRHRPFGSDDEIA
jgi:chromosome partitioning protein